MRAREIDIPSTFQLIGLNVLVPYYSNDDGYYSHLVIQANTLVLTLIAYSRCTVAKIIHAMIRLLDLDRSKFSYQQAFELTSFLGFLDCTRPFEYRMEADAGKHAFWETFFRDISKYCSSIICLMFKKCQWCVMRWSIIRMWGCVERYKQPAENEYYLRHIHYLRQISPYSSIYYYFLWHGSRTQYRY